MRAKIQAQAGSDNVFADLQVSDAAEALAKAELARQISEIINKKHLSQKEAARVLRIDQPKVSALLHGRLTGFSTERLFRFLNALGREVEIVVRSSRRQRPGIRVLAA